MPRYDLLRGEEKDGVLKGTVLWHEDKDDPGDTSETEMRVSLVNQKLVLRIDDPVLGMSMIFLKHP